MRVFINFLFFVLSFVLAAIDFGAAAENISKKKFYWFGANLVTAIFMLFNAFRALYLTF